MFELKMFINHYFEVKSKSNPVRKRMIVTLLESEIRVR